jgi:NAD(P)-dependent dehydrogenase (short-subunit alcohol dehydrogenase family)
MRENLTSGLRWQGMETRIENPRRHSLTLPHCIRFARRCERGGAGDLDAQRSCAWAGRSHPLLRIPLGRTATPEEAAGGILLMASPLASYITGHTLEVTGGAGI